MKLTSQTKLTGSIAAKRSILGAAMHNSAYKELGLDFIFIPFETTDTKDAVAGMRGLNFVGLACSMPHKQELLKYVDKVDKIAQKIGAVNTLHNVDGKITGYNSDWIGAVEALKEVELNIKGKKVVLIGAGGAARAVVYGLTKEGAKVSVFNRTKSKAKSLAKDFNIRSSGDLEDLKKVQDYDILVNSTSVGFGENKSVVTKDMIKPKKIIMDVVFSPLETSLLKVAKEKDCKIVPGWRMLIHQALFQFKLFTGQDAPFEIMEQELKKALE